MQTSKMNTRLTWLAAAWIAVIAIAYATLTHVDFAYNLYFKLAPFLMRPAMRTFAHFEHVIVFACLGAFLSLAYPRRPILVLTIVFGIATSLEILQTMTPDRHGTWIDALEKIAGGAIGILLVRTAQRMLPAGNRTSSH